jgi:hypothetical protein
MKREKKLTKKERKAASGKGPAGAKATGDQHIHCVACGRHIDAGEFDDPATATVVRCAHGSTFASCLGCTIPAQKLLDEHDRTGQPVKIASAWH